MPARADHAFHAAGPTDTAWTDPDTPQGADRKRGKRYSIRINDRPGTVCGKCPARTGEGPVGYFGEEPICDRCLDAAEPDLSAVLALNAIVRIYVLLSKRDPDHAQSFLRPLLGEFGEATQHWGAPRLIWDPLNTPIELDGSTRSELLEQTLERGRTDDPQ